LYIADKKKIIELGIPPVEIERDDDLLIREKSYQ
jgi:hypothetical protein